MVELLSAEDIKLIHNLIEEQFPSVEPGVKDPGLIDSAAKRPNQQLYGTNQTFEDIFAKAASIVEAITRWHPFIDGNKRTGLLSAFAFLYRNGYYLAIPLSSVKFTIAIADTRETDQETTIRLIKEISAWLEKHTGKNAGEFFIKVLRYFLFPVLGLIILQKIGFGKYVRNRLNDWFSIKSHPEYEKEIGDVTAFLYAVMGDAIKDLKEKQRIEKRKKKQKSKVVIITAGSSVPGCEKTNDCFEPPIVEIKRGETVLWVNEDTAAHTVTSGTPSDGSDGNFDSSLFMSGNTFSRTFDHPGEFPYFDMVHPWMSGTIIVK